MYKYLECKIIYFILQKNLRHLCLEIAFKMHIDELINFALTEDIGDGDHTSLACIPESQMGEVVLIAKEDGILAGVEIAQRVFQLLDDSVDFSVFKSDGSSINQGDRVLHIKGKSRSLLSGERLMLNIMQRMSGIATLTRKYVDACVGTKARILDTRKTTPNFRVLEKQAVRIGGGTNHRFGLYDMIMIKDNHIDFAGGIEQALLQTEAYKKKNDLSLKVIIETRNLNEVEEVLHVGKCHRLLLDNFSISETEDAVELIGGKFETESSGGINLETVRDYAHTGVDYISAGAIIHSAGNFDLSLKAI